LILAKLAGVTGRQSRSLSHLATLAGIIMMSTVSLQLVSLTQLLSEAGSSALPLVFIISAALTLVITFVIDSVIERIRTNRLLLVLLSGTLILLGCLQLLVPMTPAESVQLIAIVSLSYSAVVIWQFKELVRDYIPAADVSSVSRLLGISLSAGGLSAGLVVYLWTLLTSADALYLAMVLIAISIGYLFWFGNNLEALGSANQKGQSLIQAVVRLPRLSRQGPLPMALLMLTALLAASGIMVEYLALNRYATSYPDMTVLLSFLSQVFIVIFLAQALLQLLISKSLLEALGPVIRTILFPMVGLISLFFVAFVEGILLVIVCHIIFQALPAGIQAATDSMNRKGVTDRYQGSVEQLGMALLTPLAVLSAGLVMLVAPVSIMAVTSAALALLASGAAFMVGKSFLPALMANVESGEVNSSDLHQSPEKLGQEVQRLLQGKTPESRQLGLELARRVNLRELMEVLSLIIKMGDSEECAIIADLLIDSEDISLQNEMIRTLGQDTPFAETMQLRIAIASGSAMTQRPEKESHDPQLISLRKLYKGIFSRDRRKAIDSALEDLPFTFEILENSKSARARNFLEELLEHLPEEKQADGMWVLATFSQQNPDIVRALAKRAETIPGLRRPAVKLLSLIDLTEAEQVMILDWLEDADTPLLNAIIEGLSSMDEAALIYLLRPLLDSSSRLARRNAITLLGRINSPKSAERLQDLLRPYNKQASENLANMKHMGTTEGLEPLRIAISDSNQRIIEMNLQIATALGYERVVEHIRRAMESTQKATQERAVSALASLPNRALVVPLIPLLRYLLADKGKLKKTTLTEDEIVLLLESCKESRDPWIVHAASQLIATRADQPEVHQEDIDLNHLLLLKNVELFNSLNLDTLLAIDQALESRSYKPAEPVFKDGEPGDELFIVQSGTVELHKGSTLLVEVKRSGFFGEMALIDDSPRSATAMCVEDTTLLCLNRNVFKELTNLYPEILHALNRLLAARLRQAQSG